MFVSLANRIGLDTSNIIFGRSVMCKRKNRGPRIKPWGTLCLTDSYLAKYFIELFFNKTL